MKNFKKSAHILIPLTILLFISCSKNASSVLSTPQAFIIGHWSNDSIVTYDMRPPITDTNRQVNPNHYGSNMIFINDEILYFLDFRIGTNYDTLHYKFKNDSILFLIKKMGTNSSDTVQYSVLQLSNSKMLLLNSDSIKAFNNSPYEIVKTYMYLHKLN